MSPGDILTFWSSAGPGAWFKKDAAFDARCYAFEHLHHAAARGELCDWLNGVESALALILLLDQFPRNLYRGSAHAFATDGLALKAAAHAIAAGHDQRVAMPLRVFFYLPFEHAEDLALQQRCLALMEATGDAEFAKFAQIHLDIIARFGRFPHRNAALGRTTTPEEQAFLDAGGFSG